LQIPDEVLSALIGAISALVVVLIKDITLDAIRDRQERRRELVKQRLEEAYVPLNYLLYALATSEERKEVARLRAEILQILQKYGHLLTKHTLSGFYILVDEDQLGKAEADSDLAKRFFEEYHALRETFYKDQASSPSITKGKTLR
jgi:hypothetical protein